MIHRHPIPLPCLRLLIVVSLNLSCRHGLFEPEIVMVSNVFPRNEYLHSTYVCIKDCNTQQCLHTRVVVLNILCLNLNCDGQQHVCAPEMLISTPEITGRKSKVVRQSIHLKANGRTLKFCAIMLHNARVLILTFCCFA